MLSRADLRSLSCTRGPGNRWRVNPSEGEILKTRRTSKCLETRRAFLARETCCQNFGRVAVTPRVRWYRKEQFGGLNSLLGAARPSRARICRRYHLAQGLGSRGRAPQWQFIAEFGPSHSVRIERMSTETFVSSLPPTRSSRKRTGSTAKFRMLAVTDDKEVATDDGEESYDIEVSPDKTFQEEGAQVTTIRKRGQNLGSYATTTAIAIQDSLPPEGLVVLMSCAVGVMTGACVVLFNVSVHNIHDLVWGYIPNRGATWLRNEPLETTWQRIVLVPAGGGLLVGMLNTFRGNFERQGEDKSFWGSAKLFVRQLMKTGAAAITLGTGNALGPEGPSVEIGASIANGVTSLFKSSRERKLALVAAGSAAGISSGFNAAVSGCFFSVESVLSGLSSADSAPSLTTAMILLSSVLASVISQAGLGSDPAFHIPAYDFRSPTELPLYLLLGVFCGGVSGALIQGTTLATALFDSLRKVSGLPAGYLPPLGGLCVGAIALVYPEVLYWGFENVDVLLESHLPWGGGPSASLLLELVAAKLVATSICRGSGLVGGVYAPALFIGAALGSAYGNLASFASVHASTMWHLDVLQVAAPQAYALVGMAATLAGVCQVPLTSVLLLFELTRDYRIILPLMGAVGISSWVASIMQKKRSPPVVQINAPVTAGGVVSMTRFKGDPESQTLDAVLITNTKQSSSSGRQPEKGRSILDSDLCNLEDTLCLTDAQVEITEERLGGELLVMSAMRTTYTSLTGDTSLTEAMASLLREKEWCVLVVNQDKHLEGLLTLSDIQEEAERARTGGLLRELEKMPISGLCRRVSAGEDMVLTAYPDVTLKEAQRLMATRGLRQLPVIARGIYVPGKETDRVVLGLLDRESIKLACRAEATRRMLWSERL